MIEHFSPPTSYHHTKRYNETGLKLKELEDADVLRGGVTWGNQKTAGETKPKTPEELEASGTNNYRKH